MREIRCFSVESELGESEFGTRFTRAIRLLHRVACMCLHTRAIYTFICLSYLHID